MDILYSWSARRSGAAITVTHSTGKVVVAEISVDRRGHVLAQRLGGSEVLLLAVPAADDFAPRVSNGVSCLFSEYGPAVAAFVSDRFDAGHRLREAAAAFQSRLRAVGVCPPTVGALVADFVGRS